MNTPIFIFNKNRYIKLSEKTIAVVNNKFKALLQTLHLLFTPYDYLFSSEDEKNKLDTKSIGILVALG